MTLQPQSTDHSDNQSTSTESRSFRTAGLVVMSAAVLAAAAFVGMLVGEFTRLGISEAGSSKASSDDEPGFTSKSGPQNLKDWKNPELVLVLSGEMHGFLLPCGCSEPQYGGLERRFNFIEGLRKDRKWPVMAVDLGDLAQSTDDILSKGSLLTDHIRNFQGVLKYTTAMKALDEMKYTAMGIGWRERALQEGGHQGLSVALDNFALNNKSPRLLAANLKDRGEKERWMDMVGDWQLAKVENTRLKVGVTGLVGKSVRHSDHLKGETDVAWVDETDDVIKKALKEQKNAGVSMRVLIYQGTMDEAKRLIGQFPQFHVVLCLSDGDLAPGIPQQVGDTLIVTVGYKGHSVGVVGVFQQKPNQYEMRYQMVDIGPELETPKGKEKDNPILKLLNEYTLTMKNNPQDYLARYKSLQTSHPLQANNDTKEDTVDYVGSGECKRCHAHAYEVWSKSPHFKAYEALSDLKRTRIDNRKYDPECVVCHVTGFGYRSGFTDEKDPNFKKLKDVGCESCHGPGSRHVNEHVNGVKKPKIDAEMNPWKRLPRPREQAINATCIKCHDEENDVHWKFSDHWPKIDHPTPPEEKPKGSGSGTGEDER